MKKPLISKLFLLPALMAALGWMPAIQATAQTYTVVHSFPTDGSDGTSPNGMVLSGTTLYGTAASGGTYSYGTVFTVQTDGTSFAVLFNFNGTTDGANPSSGLVLSGNTLYGTTYHLGSADQSVRGTVFKVKTDGTGFTVLHSFLPTDGNNANAGGANPYAELILSGSTLYGTTESGGTSGNGIVFAIQTDGTGFVNLHNFEIPDGGRPVAGLVLSGNTLYGAARFRGVSNLGTLYKLNIDGSGFTVMHTFTGYSDGANPVGSLILSGTTLYGSTTAGGTFPKTGTIFKIETSGAGFTVLHGFDANVDGRFPQAALTLSGDTLYGTTYYGGSANWGTLFSLNTSVPIGTGFTVLHHFDSGSVGKAPAASVILSGNTLYGTTFQSSSSHHGTVFSFDLGCAAALMNIAQYAGVTVSGTIGCTYRIDYTTSLTPPITWTPLTTVTLTASSYLYIDTTLPSGTRFYQTVLVP
jgi:uncharacterized repeat protein (TIGR03803 family)